MAMATGDGKEEVVLREAPVLSSSEMLAKLQEKCKAGERSSYLAMYSSYCGGIITDPAMMLIPIDDHMVHRGHGVFDTAIIMDGHLYEMDAHLERLLMSASKAKIKPPFPLPILRSILIRLAAISCCKEGSLRYWLSAGPGNFDLSSAGCTESIFYAVVVRKDYSPQCGKGVRAITSTIPMKSPYFATMKSVDYIDNVLSKMEAEEKGANAAIWIDERGNVAEGPHGNIAFINKNRELLLPSFDKILGGCTAKRLLDLAPTLVEKGKLKGIKTADVSVSEAKNSDEMMYVGSGLPILPIVSWDEQTIGDGEVGELTMVLSDLLWEDMKSGPGTLRVPIPYQQKLGTP